MPRTEDKGEGLITTSYEILCGRRRISLQRASSAREALVEYLRAMGCRDEKMSAHGPAAISWNGAVYRAVAVDE